MEALRSVRGSPRAASDGGILALNVLRHRSYRPEILDAPRIDEEELVRSLRDVDAVNRWLGGYRALRLHLEELVRERKGGRILDVGVGDAGTLLHLSRWAGSDWWMVGVDVQDQVARVAHRRTRARNEIHVLRGDGLRLPFPDSSFDAVLCTLTLHHFGDDEAAALIREMARVSASRVVVNDLERTFPNYLGALVLARTAWRGSRITRHDGPLSVRRAFTRRELEAVGARAGLEEATVRRHFFFRLVLEGRAE